MIFKNETYDKLRFIALVFAPISVFLIAVCSALNVPGTDTFAAILAAAEALLGSLVEICRREYHSQEQDGIKG